MTVRWLVGDVFERMAELPDGSVDLVMTSPPFLALRSYLPADHPDKAREIGSEATPAEFIDTLLRLTAEWRRLLAPHGSICVELGDTYAGSGGAGGDYVDGGLRDGQARFGGSGRAGRLAAYSDQRGNPDGMRDTTFSGANTRSGGGAGWPLDKSLAGIPAAYELSLAYGYNVLDRRDPDSPAGRWRVRNLVAWVRPNPPVGALGDKFRPATSYLTVATLARDRWFDLDAVRQPANPNTHPRTAKGIAVRPNTTKSANDDRTGGNRSTLGIQHASVTAPPLDWWEIPPGGYPGSHYAVYPPELCVRPIEAMCPRRVCRTCGVPSRRLTGPAEYVQSRGGGTPATMHMREGSRRSDGVNAWDTTGQGDQSVTRRAPTTGWTTCGCPSTDGFRLDGFHTGGGWRPGVVLDPFAGSGTTGMVAADRGRTAILIDIDERNVELARQRLGFYLVEVDAGRPAEAS